MGNLSDKRHSKFGGFGMRYTAHFSLKEGDPEVK